MSRRSLDVLKYFFGLSLQIGLTLSYPLMLVWWHTVHIFLKKIGEWLLGENNTEKWNSSMPTGKNVRIIFSMISKSLNIVMDIDRDQIGLGYFERTIYIIPMLPSQYYGSKIRLQGMKSVTHQVKKIELYFLVWKIMNWLCGMKRNQLERRSRFLLGRKRGGVDIVLGGWNDNDNK